MNVLRLFIPFGMLAAATASPALGQEVVPTIGPAGGGTQSAAAIPDFSGIWTHPYFPGFEPPASGAGPIVNRSRLRGGPRDGVGNANQFVGDYANPILRPQAAEVVRKYGEISLAGGTYPTPSNQCWPSGVPYIFFQHGMQMLQLPEKIVFLYLRNHESREVRLNRPHPADAKPSWYGDSVGHYEGDTLVVDTIGVKTGPFAMVDMYGTPFSPALHIVERYRCSIMQMQRERSTATVRRIFASARASSRWNSIRPIGANTSSLRSPSTMRAFSPCLGPRR
jgi:hypothetical protein